MHPRDILNSYGISPKRSLGQNFIFDDNILSRIVNLADLKVNDSILEIGPGIGSLTRHLATKSRSVVAVEIDDRLVPILEDQLRTYDNILVLRDDILDVDLATLFEDPYFVVANVPYYITGAILRHLFNSDPIPVRMVLTVQLEVAQRMTAQPGRMSLLAAIAQYYAQIEMGFMIKAGSFWPKPDVDSAVVKLTSYPERLVEKNQEEEFFRLLRIGFGQKRKQLQKNLRSLGFSREHILNSFQNAGIDATRRAETLSIKEWQMLYYALF